MLGKKRLNKDLIFGKILPAVGFGVGVCAAAGGALYVSSLVIDVDSDIPLPTLYEHNKIPGDAGTYRITGPDQIAVQQGDYKYTFNYEARQVIIEGKDTFEPIAFSDFSNPAMIDDIKRKGCIISGTFTAAVDEYLAQDGINERHREFAANQRGTAASFTGDNCPIAGSIPHVR